MTNQEKKEKQERFIQLRVIEGKSFDSIKKELNVSKQALINWSGEFEQEIIELKASCKQELFEKFKLGYKERLELYFNLFQKVKDSLLESNLDNLTFDKQFQLLEKLELKIFEGQEFFKSEILEPSQNKKLLENMMEERKKEIPAII